MNKCIVCGTPTENGKYCSQTCNKISYKIRNNLIQPSCRYCHIKIRPKDGFMIHCSPEHQEKDTVKKVTLCKYCKKENVREKGKRQEYCDIVCKDRYWYALESVKIGRKQKGTPMSCITCKKIIPLKAGNQLYCGKKCRIKRLIVCKRCHKQKEHYGRDMCVNCWKYVRRLKLTPYIMKNCEWCGRLFKTRKVSQLFCGNESCRQKSYRKESSAYRNRVSSESYKKAAIESGRMWRERHPIKLKRRLKAYASSTRGKISRKLRSFRRRKRMESHSELTINQKIKIEERDKICVYCQKKKPTTDDHIIPISNEEGTHHYLNIVRACGSCNFSKHTKMLRDWFRTMYCKKNNITAKTINPIVWVLLKKYKRMLKKKNQQK